MDTYPETETGKVAMSIENLNYCTAMIDEHIGRNYMVWMYIYPRLLSLVDFRVRL